MGDSSNSQVFINCPFSDDYRALFEALVFSVMDCGFQPRCALETDDSGEVRFEKIIRIIRDCRYGIHDLSMMEADATTGMARLNMSFELGLFLGARRFGSRKAREKIALILDVDRFRYQRSISDIAGHDIRAHAGDPKRAITHVRDWLQVNARDADIPGGAAIGRRYEAFVANLADYCSELGFGAETLTFVDLCKLIERWLVENA